MKSTWDISETVLEQLTVGIGKRVKNEMVNKIGKKKAPNISSFFKLLNDTKHWLN